MSRYWILCLWSVVEINFQQASCKETRIFGVYRAGIGNGYRGSALMVHTPRKLRRDVKF